MQEGNGHFAAKSCLSDECCKRDRLFSIIQAAFAMFGVNFLFALKD
jgi:hypothetical protein